MQALVDAVSPPDGAVCRHVLCTPQPGQDIGCKHSDPRTGSNASQGLFGAGFAVGELVAANNDGDQAGYLRHGSGEKRLQRGKAVVERGAALGEGRRRKYKQSGKQVDSKNAPGFGRLPRRLSASA